MSLILTHGYFIADDAIEQRIMRPYPPLGLLSISAWLDRDGIDHQVIDATFLNAERFVQRVRALRPRLIAFYVTLMTRRSVLRLIAALGGGEGGPTIVLGGPDVRHNAADYLQHGAHLLVVGEGEQTMADVARLPAAACRDAAALAAIPGLIHADSQGQPVFTGERKFVPELDELPEPARHRIDLQPYFQAWRSAHGQTSLNISTQRGCPYKCSWCSRAVYGTSYRRRSPQQVVAELGKLVRQYAPDQFWFVDDVFTINHNWLAGFADALDAAGLRIRYECITRADRMNARVVQLLARSGCTRVWIGAESGSQRILDAMKRQVRVEQVTAMIRAASDAGIQTGTFLMLGYPGETESDIVATERYLREARPDLFTVTLAYPIRGTQFHDQVADQATAPPFDQGSDRDRRFPRTYSDAYYRHAVRLLTHTHAMTTALHPFGLRALAHRAAWCLSRLGMWWHRRVGVQPA
ncbi:B12-binding domain-containing radical SAM protein [Ideonella azotifigens]|uniref:Radical SAM protein n=1 Tax=Ideonella azotifigens TaxID=513160 RepID=A0ABN1KDH8_9BURK|nr:radical SAM protein [Ideonella azotifigens]MCD2342089.1 B12-binding domain-containing radical SAM protein [Ideonella azotifigens]